MTGVGTITTGPDGAVAGGVGDVRAVGAVVGCAAHPSALAAAKITTRRRKTRGMGKLPKRRRDYMPFQTNVAQPPSEMVFRRGPRPLRGCATLPGMIAMKQLIKMVVGLIAVIDCLLPPLPLGEGWGEGAWICPVGEFQG
jgi:hypothetical protein